MNPPWRMHEPCSISSSLFLIHLSIHGWWMQLSPSCNLFASCHMGPWQFTRMSMHHEEDWHDSRFRVMLPWTLQWLLVYMIVECLWCWEGSFCCKLMMSKSWWHDYWLMLMRHRNLDQNAQNFFHKPITPKLWNRTCKLLYEILLRKKIYPRFLIY